MYLGPCISATTTKNIVAIRSKISAVCQVRATMVPEKNRCYQVVAVYVKNESANISSSETGTAICHKKSLMGIRVMAKSAGSQVPVFTFVGALLHGLDRSFKTADFYRGQRVHEHKFRPKLLLHGLILTTIL
jgi:hypothetical protein